MPGHATCRILGRSIEFVTAAGSRRTASAVVAAPLKREDTAIGAVVLRNVYSSSLMTQQIALLETFAAQAVIAIENVRLFSELKESLEQQTASGEILQVISQSPTDVTPVLEAVATAPVRFCGAEDVSIFLKDGARVDNRRA
jgi:GAF domain-containing protein